MLNPNSVQSLYSKGIKSLQEGDILDSIQCWNELIEIDDQDAVVLQNLAFCHLKLSQYEDAIQIVDKALLLDSNNIELYKIRAESAYYLSNFSLAITDSETFISVDKSDAWLWQILINSLIFSDDVEKASPSGSGLIPQGQVLLFALSKIFKKHNHTL